jgi:hypothetical protein
MGQPTCYNAAQHILITMAMLVMMITVIIMEGVIMLPRMGQLPCHNT